MNFQEYLMQNPPTRQQCVRVTDKNFIFDHPQPTGWRYVGLEIGGGIYRYVIKPGSSWLWVGKEDGDDVMSCFCYDN